MIIHLEPDILESEVKWALGNITTNKASGGDGIPAELFQVLKDDAVKVLHSICQQIWKTAVATELVKVTSHSNPILIPKKAMPKNVQREVSQLCLTLCDPMDCSWPGSSVHGISQTRVLEWVAISSSRGDPGIKPSQPRE